MPLAKSAFTKFKSDGGQSSDIGVYKVLGSIGEVLHSEVLGGSESNFASSSSESKMMSTLVVRICRNEEIRSKAGPSRNILVSNLTTMISIGMEICNYRK